MANEKGRGARFGILAVVGVVFWAFVFGVLYRLLMYFKGVEEIGPLLAGKLLGLMLVSFFSILLLSNVITALSSFFLAKDLDLLVSGPVDWLRLYCAKLLETVIASSWMVALMAVPMFTAYGLAYHGGWLFAPFAIAVFIPFLLIPSVIGSKVHNIRTVVVFPAPLGPRKPKISPFFIARSIPRTASMPPLNVLVRFFASTAKSSD